MRQTDKLAFRKKKIKDKVQEIEDLLTGRDNSILPYVVDENGRYSESMSRYFIGRLLDALEQYGKQTGYWSEGSMSEVMREYMECFLYCVIRSAASELDWLDDTVWDLPKQSFRTFLDAAVDVTSKEQKAYILYDELYTGVFCLEGLFKYCVPMYEKLTGEDITTTIPKEWLDIVKPMHEADIEYMLEAAQENEFDFEDHELSEEEVAKAYEEYVNNMSPEERREYDEMTELLDEDQKRRAESEKRFVENFLHKDEFIRSFLRYRELYFSDEKLYQNITRKLIEGMLDIYLVKTNMSYLANEEVFVRSYMQLDRAIKNIRHMKGRD